MVRRDVASARVTRATAWLADAEQLFTLDEDAFQAATKERARTEALVGIPALKAFLATVGREAGL